MTYLDTHVIVFLYEGLGKKFSLRSKKEIARGDLWISPMVMLELQYLNEIGRQQDSPEQILNEVRKLTDISLNRNRFDRVVKEAISISWTRDPFDRLIVAEAMLQDAPLVTADENIRKHYKQAVW